MSLVRKEPYSVQCMGQPRIPLSHLAHKQTGRWMFEVERESESESERERERISNDCFSIDVL